MTYFLMGTSASPEQQQRAQAAIAKMSAYITERLEERRGSDADDLLSVLLRAEESEQVSPPELLWQCTGLILAGFETTTGLIGNGLRQLLLHPEQWRRLQESPELIETAVEECLRYDPPIVATARYLHEDAEFGGYRIPVNSRVVAVLASANRDPEVFEQPDRFDIGRAPNKHLGFGGGPHVCLGAYLARLEAREAIGTLARRLPNLSLVSGQQHWTGSLFRILAELPVRAVS